MNSALLQKYQSLASHYQTLSDIKRKHIRFIAFARLISFVGIIPAYYYLHPVQPVLALLVSVLLLMAFLFLIQKFIQSENQLHIYEQLKSINLNEIKALNRDFSSFDPGSEFADTHHEYSYDLDIYGVGSTFQFLNRTVTIGGKKRLSALMNQTQRSVDEIAEKQKAIQELSGELNWRQEFLAKGKLTDGTKDQSIEKIEQAVHLNSVKTLKFLLILLPPLTILLIALSIADIDPYSFYRLALLTQWIIVGIYIKTILKFHQKFDNQGKILGRYAGMLKQIETFNFKSAYLLSLKEQLKYKGRTASEITSELQKSLDQFDYSKNLLIGFVLDSVFLWDIRCLVKLNKWQQEYAGTLNQWFDAIGEMDALISLANCNYNHPDWATPVAVDSGFRINAVKLGHPLIAESKSVTNSFHISGDEQIVIITGANMAGKSTFLRTVGINLVLASNGCKVCAESFEFSPIRVFTNMRTSDNLMNDESYFYAELLRLQTMLKLIREDEKLFVIVDEMLKGTNSVDKLNGSKELIRQLIALKTHGIVATHDLSLTDLAQIYPSAIKNQCFEVQLNADELKFDYTLSDGVTQTMNATFLMKKMGIIPK